MKSPAGENFDQHHDGGQRDHPPGVFFGGAAICGVVVAVPVGGEFFWLHGRIGGIGGSDRFSSTLAYDEEYAPTPLMGGKPKLEVCRHGS